MSRKPRLPKRLGNYEYNRDENPLPEKERKVRELQRQKLLKQFADRKKKKQEEYVALDPSKLGGQFSAVFAELAGDERAAISNSTPEELRVYSQKLVADIKWIEALLKELNKEREFLDGLQQWMADDSKPKPQDPQLQSAVEQAEPEEVPTTDTDNETRDAESGK